MAKSTHPLAGRALITGGTSGIGLEFARQLAERGLNLVLVAREQDRLERTAKQFEWRHGVTVEVIAADLGTPEGRSSVADRLLDDESPVNVFVNNAGAGLYEPLVTDNLEPHRKAIEVMLWAVLELGAAAGRAMKQRGSGTIINTASISGLVPMGGYSAIKSWVKTYSEALYLQLRAHGVHVTTFMPGWVRTEFHQRTGVKTSNIPDFLWLEPERVVRECLEDTEKGKVMSIPSKRFKVISFLAERGPQGAVRAVVQKINKGRQ